MGKRLYLNVIEHQYFESYWPEWAEKHFFKFNYELIKRILDISISSIFLLSIGWWLFPMIALGVQLSSKGPVLFKQERNGYKGKTFDCLKFRTMYYNSHGCFKQATRNDSRITSVGKFLRKTSLDELPQIFNVLKGDMSLVGPRPHPLPLDEMYAPKLGAYLSRYDSKPGITGLAQIKGFRGATATDYEMKNRLRMDLVYVKRRNIALDLVIIFKSFVLIFKGGPNAF